MSFDGENITSLDTVELLGITLNKKINFKRHITNICHKANNKAKALFRIRKFLNLEQVLTEAYISSNFSYCPLIWMFCGKVSDNFIVRTHYRTLGRRMGIVQIYVCLLLYFLLKAAAFDVPS